MKRRTSGMASMAGIALLLASCTSHPKPATTSSDHGPLPSVDAVYAQAGITLRKAGLLRVVITMTTNLSGKKQTLRRELWLDARHDLARGKNTAAGHVASGQPEPDTQFLDAGGVHWGNGRPGAPRACHGQTAPVGELLGCPEPTETGTVHVERGRFAGRDVLVLVRELKSSSEDSGMTAEIRTYLDPATALPRGALETGTFDDGSRHLFRVTSTYRSGPAGADARAAGFVTPAALGLRPPPDPVSQIPAGLPVYWLGRTYAPGGALPSIELGQVEPDQAISGAILTYVATKDRYGPPLLSIQVSPRAAFEAMPVRIDVGRCPRPSALTLRAAKVDLYCTAGSQGISAFVHLPDAVLNVNAPATSGPNGQTRSPYDERSVILAVIRALHHRS